MKKMILYVVLTIFTYTCTQLIADAPYNGNPKTIAHEFLDLEKDFGAGAAEYSALNSLINKALVRVSLKKNSSTEDAVRTLLQIDALLKDEGFVFRQNYLLSTGIKTKSIDCDNYCALYIAIAEVMKIPVVPVYAPNHSFLRFYFDDGSYLNWEPTQAMPQPDSYYMQQLNISAGSVNKGVYLRTLTRQEFFAVQYNNIGSHLLMIKKYTEALTCFNTAIKLYPLFSSAWHNRGTAFYALGSGKEALADLLKANELDPNRASTHNTLGDIYLDNKEYDRAAAEFITSIKLNPADYVPYNNMAYVKKAQGKNKEADAWLKKSQEIKSKYGTKRNP